MQMTGQETSAEVDLLLDSTLCPMISKTVDQQHQQSWEELVNIVPRVNIFKVLQF